jgi:Domain of unknown function (DUF4020)/SIR2-like domain
MRFGNIDIPKHLYDAQQAGELVVFAGAGVSIPEPSHYPDFNELADQIANGTLAREGEPQNLEPVDRFLGRLFDRGTKVHEIAKRILSDPKSQPNSLHRHVLKLFDGEQKVRIVTTNFDDHFGAVSREEAKDSLLKIYCAPALPPGDKFTGLVHLHGSVKEHPGTLILTDGDFGKAYLTEGWARRFLQSVFSRFTVLFVGYSHNDPVMNYLARGLTSRPSGPCRYAITESGKEAHWNYLGILPITHAAGQFDEIETALGRWSSQALMGPIDHDAKIKKIVERPVPPAGEDLDYIAACLLDAPKTRFFTEHAKRVDWLHWIEDQGPFARLFRHDVVTSGEEAEVSHALAYWFARRFAFMSQDAALNILLKKNSSLGPHLWNALAHSVLLESPPVENLRRWVPILIQSRPLNLGTDLLGMILCKYLHPSNSSVAQLLFASLLRPTAQLEQGFKWSSQDGDTESRIDLHLDTAGESYSLNQAWELLFSQDIDRYVEFLVPMVTAYLNEATLLMKLYGKTYSGFDLITLGMIGPRGMNSNRSDREIGVLVRVAMETMEWAAANDLSRTKQLITSWWNGDCLALKKLAVIGISKCKKWKSEERLRWVLQRDLIYFPGLEEEVRNAIKETYSQATSNTKKRLLHTILKGPKTGENDRVEYRAGRIYNRLQVLAGISPECKMVAESIVELRNEFPFLPTSEAAYPEPIGWSGVPELIGSLKKDELLAKPPTDSLNELLSLYQDEDSKSHRVELLNEVEDAVSEKNEWGLLLAQELRKQNLWASDLWRPVIEGFNQYRVTESGRRQLLQILAKYSQVLPYVSGNVLRLLEHGIAKHEEVVDEETLMFASTVAVNLWPSLVASNEKRVETTEEWLSAAINHDAGILMEVQLGVLGKIRKLRKDGWHGIPEEVKSHFRAVVDGSSYASEMARILLASQVHFLFDLDAEWTPDCIFQLFDWELDERRALQAWHGYLFWGRWSNETIERFMRYYTMTWKRLSLLSERPHRQLLQHLAAIAVFAIVEPLRSGWLMDFIKDIEPRERKIWASSVGSRLNEATPDSRRKVWHGWMKSYWQSRLDGNPAPLSTGEVEEMVAWAVESDAEFPEAVLFLLRGPKPNSEHRLVYTQLAESAVPQNHPVVLGNLLAWLLQRENKLPHDYDKIHTMVRSIAPNCPNKKRITSICDELMRLGDHAATKLRSETELISS